MIFNRTPEFIWPFIGLIGSFVMILSNPLTAQTATDPEKRFEKLGTLKSPLIPESSGMAIAETQADAFWTINDSGHTNDLFCVSFTGQVLAQVKLRNAKNVDWESMAWFVKDGVRYLVVADVGDNRSRRQKLQVYFFPEPKFEPQEEMVKMEIDCLSFEFVYPDGPRDCEALAIDPETLDIWLVEKIMRPRPDRKRPGLYRIAAGENWLDEAFRSSGIETEPNQTDNLANQPRLFTADRVGDFPFLFITGMNFSADGNRLIVRNYLQAFLFEKTAEQSWAEILLAAKPTTVRLPLQRQGEAIAFTSDSCSIIVTSEFVGQPIWKIHLDPILNRTESAPSETPKNDH